MSDKPPGFQTGYEARRDDGVPVEGNPYKAGSMLWKNWLAGWQEADRLTPKGGDGFGNACPFCVLHNLPERKDDMYREKWVADILDDRSVLTLALDVHMTTHGSIERGNFEQERDLLALRQIESTWTNHGRCDFDDAVLSVVRAAIAEANEKKTRKGKPVKELPEWFKELAKQVTQDWKGYKTTDLGEAVFDEFDEQFTLQAAEVVGLLIEKVTALQRELAEVTNQYVSQGNRLAQLLSDQKARDRIDRKTAKELAAEWVAEWVADPVNVSELGNWFTTRIIRLRSHHEDTLAEALQEAADAGKHEWEFARRDDGSWYIANIDHDEGLTRFCCVVDNLADAPTVIRDATKPPKPTSAEAEKLFASLEANLRLYPASSAVSAKELDILKAAVEALKEKEAREKANG